MKDIPGFEGQYSNVNSSNVKNSVGIRIQGGVNDKTNFTKCPKCNRDLFPDDPKINQFDPSAIITDNRCGAVMTLEIVKGKYQAKQK